MLVRTAVPVTGVYKNHAENQRSKDWSGCWVGEVQGQRPQRWMWCGTCFREQGGPSHPPRSKGGESGESREPGRWEKQALYLGTASTPPALISANRPSPLSTGATSHMWPLKLTKVHYSEWALSRSHKPRVKCWAPNCGCCKGRYRTFPSPKKIPLDSQHWTVLFHCLSGLGVNLQGRQLHPMLFTWEAVS